MTRSITSPNHLRDTQLLRTIAEVREADRLAQSGDEEPDDNRRVCRTCRRFTGLGEGDWYTLRRLNVRYDDLDAVMDGAGICAGGDDEEDRAPSLVLSEDGTCGEWEPCQ